MGYFTSSDVENTSAGKLFRVQRNFFLFGFFDTPPYYLVGLHFSKFSATEPESISSTNLSHLPFSNFNFLPPDTKTAPTKFSSTTRKILLPAPEDQKAASAAVAAPSVAAS